VGFAILLELSQVPATQAAAPHPPHWIVVWGCSAAEPFPHVGDSPIFDSGDNLHPSDAGYAAMPDAIHLALFAGAR